jgi:hypothetical protein
MHDPELFYVGEGGVGYDGPEIGDEVIPEDEEFQEEEEVEEDDGTMQGWHPSRNKPENLCKYLRGLGLCTVFPNGNAYKLVVGGEFHGPFPTQRGAQLAAKSLKPRRSFSIS